MSTIDKRKNRLLEELQDKEYRDAYTSAAVDIGIAFQIKALREQRQWTQMEFGKIAKMAQARIHELEDPDRPPSLRTLKRLANAFDVGLIVRFVPISEIVKYDLDLSDSHSMALSSNSAGVNSYKDDAYFRKPEGQDSLELFMPSPPKGQFLGAGGSQIMDMDTFKQSRSQTGLSLGENNEAAIR